MATGFTLSYGGYSHSVSESAVAIERHALLTEGDQAYGIEERWRVRGFLQAADPDALATAITALETGYASNNQTLKLLTPTGGTARQLLGDTPLGGTQVVSGPSFPEDGSSTAEFSTFRHYQIEVVGRYKLPGVSDNVILSWYEILTFRGGGPAFVHLQPLTGLPQKQQVAESTPYYATQRGEAVGLKDWPSAPAPIWPDAYLPARSSGPNLRSPKRREQGFSQVFVEYHVDWSYEFEDASPLQGTPTLLNV